MLTSQITYHWQQWLIIAILYTSIQRYYIQEYRELYTRIRIIYIQEYIQE